jgi:hypothetical protein
MKNINKLVGINLKNPTKKIRHSKLTRWMEDSCYKVICPECGEGILCVSRSQITFEIIPDDYCMLCGQHFYYTDYKLIGCNIIEIRKEKLKRILNG